MQEFYICKDSNLPTLAMEIIYDGRSDYNKFYDAVQNSEITFTMTNMDTNVVRVANAPCYIKLREDNGCVDKYLICYDWKKRDTRECGRYKGEFTIHFNRIKGETKVYPEGDLMMPIREPLCIIIQ